MASGWEFRAPRPGAAGRNWRPFNRDAPVLAQPDHRWRGAERGARPTNRAAIPISSIAAECRPSKGPRVFAATTTPKAKRLTGPASTGGHALLTYWSAVTT